MKKKNEFWEKEDYSEFIFGTICALCFAFVIAMAMINELFNITIVVYLMICLAGMFAPKAISRYLLNIIEFAKNKVIK